MTVQEPGAPAWGYYGRRTELQNLVRVLRYGKYNTVSVVGGRGVGKTELIRRACHAVRELKPTIYIEFPVPESQDLASVEDARIDVCKSLTRQAVNAGLGDALAEAEQNQPGRLYFKQAFEDLLGAGAVMVLDEFQNSALVRLMGCVTPVINNFRSLYGPDTSGKTILAGSHQQEMLRILGDPRAPLYGRTDFDIRLYPLPAEAVLQMASEQGWLSKPKRFLTAYTAFGGNPRLWRRMAEERNRNPLPEPPGGDDEAWQTAFLQREITRIKSDPREQFDYQSLVTLNSGTRKVVELVARHFRGVRMEEVRALFEKDEQDRHDLALSILELHLHLIERTARVKPYGPPKIRMRDLPARFQLTVVPHRPIEDTAGKSDLSPAIAALQDAEAYALERLTGEWLRALPAHSNVAIGVNITGPDGGSVEIDAVAWPDSSNENPRIALCSCKRNPGKHRPGKTAADFLRFAEYDLNQGIEFPEKPRWLMVSPEKPKEFSGFEAFGIRDMARSLGFEIRPWPAPADSRPEHDFDDTPSPGF
ncbi:MAG: hypothetical protein OXF74_07530 [Rhodobacteraceae bacterium]|nr:hypothetical protein [Paracoccaceae bacterium]